MPLTLTLTAYTPSLGAISTGVVIFAVGMRRSCCPLPFPFITLPSIEYGLARNFEASETDHDVFDRLHTEPEELPLFFQQFNGPFLMLPKGIVVPDDNFPDAQFFDQDLIDKIIGQ